MYRQCSFVSGSTRTVGWVEKRYAKIGLVVTLEGEGERLWKVESISDKEISIDEARERERAHVRHRKATDI